MPRPEILLPVEEYLRAYIVSQIKLKPCLFLDYAAVRNIPFARLAEVAEKYTLLVFDGRALMVVTGLFPNLYTVDLTEIEFFVNLAKIYNVLHFPAKLDRWRRDKFI